MESEKKIEINTMLEEFKTQLSELKTAHTKLINEIKEKEKKIDKILTNRLNIITLKIDSLLETIQNIEFQLNSSSFYMPNE